MRVALFAAIIYGTDEAIYVEWGVDATGSHELVVEGDLCLVPASSPVSTEVALPD